MTIFGHRNNNFRSQEWLFSVTGMTIFGHRNDYFFVTGMTIFGHRNDYFRSQEWLFFGHRNDYFFVTGMTIFGHRYDYFRSQEWLLFGNRNEKIWAKCHYYTIYLQDIYVMDITCVQLQLRSFIYQVCCVSG